MHIYDVVVIGAGIAGLSISQALHKSGKSVLCIEKARGSGGRISSKRIKIDGSEIGFDLGSTCFTAKSAAFINKVHYWREKGVVDAWLEERGETQFVGVPRNSSLTRDLASDVSVEFGMRVSKLMKVENVWQLFHEVQGEETLLACANEVVLATPSAQTYELLPDEHELKKELISAKIKPQWVVMFAFDEPLPIPDLVTFPSENIQCISYENSKPQRIGEHGYHIYCVQASEQWSTARLDVDKDNVAEELALELFKTCHKSLQVKHEYVHRWLYAQGYEQCHAKKGYLKSDDGLYVCGDYLLSQLELGGVEAAFLSANALSQEMCHSNSSIYE